MITMHKQIFYIFMICATIMISSQSMAQQLWNGLNVTPVENSGTSEDLCPEPKTALEEKTGDLAKIQSDITRYTLCVQRAQLLQRLNELTIENIDTLDSAVTQISENSFQKLDVAQIEEIFMKNFSGAQLQSAPPQSTDASGAIPAPIISEPVKKWLIQNITGQGQNLQAVLVSDQEDIITVKSGDVIPGTQERIRSIQASGVTLTTKNKENINLQWLN